MNNSQNIALPTNGLNLSTERGFKPFGPNGDEAFGMVDSEANGSNPLWDIGEISNSLYWRDIAGGKPFQLMDLASDTVRIRVEARATGRHISKI